MALSSTEAALGLHLQALEQPHKSKLYKFLHHMIYIIGHGYGVFNRSEPPFSLTSYCNGHQGSIDRLTTENLTKQQQEAAAWFLAVPSATARVPNLGYMAAVGFMSSVSSLSIACPLGLSRCGTVQSHKHKHF